MKIQYVLNKGIEKENYIGITRGYGTNFMYAHNICIFNGLGSFTNYVNGKGVGGCFIKVHVSSHGGRGCYAKVHVAFLDRGLKSYLHGGP